VKFLIDAQLPARLSHFLTASGYDTVHTSDLPEGNRTTDADISELADAQGRIVVTKDWDFRDGHLLRFSPLRLMIVATGNISNTYLLTLIKTNLDAIVAAFTEADFVELGPTAIVVHSRRGDRYR
jgi:predicted nuclease of predicted toxin-antitoxin system